MLKKIEAYNLVEFLNCIQKAVDEGYRIDQTTNERVAFSAMGYYRVVMTDGKQVPVLLQERPKVPSEEVQEEPVGSTTDIDKIISDAKKADDFTPSVVFTAEVKEPVKRGRKPINRGV
jgi:hypothetical protein